jgi:anti-anti-sigma factor
VNQTLSMQALPADGYVVVRVAGELDVDSAPDAQAFLRELLAGRGRRLVADVEGLTFADAAGIMVLLSTGQRAEEIGGWLRLVGACPHLRRLLRILDPAATLPVYDTVRAAAGADGPPALRVLNP